MNFPALLLFLVLLITIVRMQSDSTEARLDEANKDDLSEVRQDLDDNLEEWGRNLLKISSSPSIKIAVRNGMHLVRNMLVLDDLKDTDIEDTHDELQCDKSSAC